MTKWEYKSFCLSGDAGEDERYLDVQGELGWELVIVVKTVFAGKTLLRAYMKRPVAPSEGDPRHP